MAQAQSTGTVASYNHPSSLDKNVVKNLIRIYENLSKDDLLSRCLGGHTQNANESFNLWRSSSKDLNAGFKFVEISAHSAA